MQAGSPGAHSHLPRSFRLQTRELLLCCQQRTELPSSVVQLVLASLLEAEALIATTACSQCGKGSQKNSTCSRCKSVYYCGRECQKAAWAGHKKECKRVRKKIENPQQVALEEEPFYQFARSMGVVDEEAIARARTG